MWDLSGISTLMPVRVEERRSRRKLRWLTEGFDSLSSLYSHLYSESTRWDWQASKILQNQRQIVRLLRATAHCLSYFSVFFSYLNVFFMHDSAIFVLAGAHCCLFSQDATTQSDWIHSLHEFKRASSCKWTNYNNRVNSLWFSKKTIVSAHAPSLCPVRLIHLQSLATLPLFSPVSFSFFSVLWTWDCSSPLFGIWFVPAGEDVGIPFTLLVETENSLPSTAS